MINKIFYIVMFSYYIFKLSVYFMFAAHFNSDWPHQVLDNHMWLAATTLEQFLNSSFRL